MHVFTTYEEDSYVFKFVFKKFKKFRGGRRSSAPKPSLATPLLDLKHSFHNMAY